MNSRTIWCLLGLLALGWSASVASTVRRVSLDGTVYPASTQRVIRAIDAAEAEGDALVLILMDTPGGRVDATQDLIKRMLSAKVPVAVWVGPSGAQAASAGFILLAAADLAAMAPGTRTGAASVISQAEEDDAVVMKKANEDMAALVRSIAEQRGRDVKAAEDAVREATSYTEKEALDKKLIDGIFSTAEAWLESLDGRTLKRFDGTETTLDLSPITFVESEEGAKDRFLYWIGSPEVIYILLLIGLAGLYFEFQNPGMIIPAVIGILALGLFALGTQLLPVSMLGVSLIVFGLFLFLLEIKITSMGLLGLAGTIALLAGSLMFIDSPIKSLRLSLWFVLPSVIVMSTFCFVVMRMAIKAQQLKIATGGESLIGRTAKLELNSYGQSIVRLHGETWQVRFLTEDLEPDTMVRVVDREGLTLVVEPEQE